jgi:putative Holliday junction resolvase
MKHLALDYGTKIIGIAVSDQGGIIAFPRTSLKNTSLPASVHAITKIVAEEKIEKIIVGWPTLLDGQRNTQTDRVEKFILALRQATTCPLEIFDERLSTKEAVREYQRLQQNKKSPPDPDALAASVILKYYLEKSSKR